MVAPFFFQWPWNCTNDKNLGSGHIVKQHVIIKSLCQVLAPGNVSITRYGLDRTKGFLTVTLN